MSKLTVMDVLILLHPGVLLCVLAGLLAGILVDTLNSGRQ